MPVEIDKQEIQIQAEKISKNIIELISRLKLEYEESQEYLMESVHVLDESVDFLSAKVNENISSASKLIHSFQEINMDMDSVDRLLLQIQGINQLLDQVEKRSQ